MENLVKCICNSERNEMLQARNRFCSKCSDRLFEDEVIYHTEYDMTDRSITFVKASDVEQRI